MDISVSDERQGTMKWMCSHINDEVDMKRGIWRDDMSRVVKSNSNIFGEKSPHVMIEMNGK